MRPIIVFYDGWCSLCRSSVKNFKRLDWFQKIEFLSFRDDHIIQEYKLDPEMLELRIQSLRRRDHKMEEGIDCINRICKNTPLLWWMVPVLCVSSFLGIGQVVYDFIAKRRNIFPTGGCDEEAGCQIPVKK